MRNSTGWTFRLSGADCARAPPDVREKQGTDGVLRTRDIDPDALKVVRKLLNGGHEAYLVGGCVRDLYLKRRPKDFDVATSARPEQIRKVFRNSRIIGRRFKLAHVFFGSKIIETSTFRAAPNQSDEHDPLITHDNEWGSIEDDARRRDFTINGLFYDVESREVLDFVGGIDDLERGIIRTIGEAELRFREDPVRMIRAVKFAARLDFTVDHECWESLLEVAPDIARCSRARLLEELYKLLRSGSARRSFELLLESKLFEGIWPRYLALFQPDGGLRRTPLNTDDQPRADTSTLFWRYLDALDTFVLATKQVPSNGVLLATLFAPFLDRSLTEDSRADLDSALEDLMTKPGTELGVARRDREQARQVFMAQRRMLQPSRRPGRSSLVQRQYFHDALIFLGFSVAARGIEHGSELQHWRELANRQQRAGREPASRSSQRRGGNRRRRGGRSRNRGGNGGSGAKKSSRNGS